MRWEIEFAPKAERQLKKLDPPTRLQVLNDLLVLKENPYPAPPKGKKLRGFKVPTYRFRSGDYRAIYRVLGSKVVIGAVFHRIWRGKSHRSSRQAASKPFLYQVPRARIRDSFLCASTAEFREIGRALLLEGVQALVGLRGLDEEGERALTQA